MEIIKNNKIISLTVAALAAAWAVLQKLDHIESAPSNVARMSEKTIAWWYDDDQWTGFFAEFPVYMEIQSTDLSDESILLDISSTHGEITGEIYTPKLCAVLPPRNHRRVKGKVLGSKQEILPSFRFLNIKTTNLYLSAHSRYKKTLPL